MRAMLSPEMCALIEALRRYVGEQPWSTQSIALSDACDTLLAERGPEEETSPRYACRVCSFTTNYAKPSQDHHDRTGHNMAWTGRDATRAELEQDARDIPSPAVAAPEREAEREGSGEVLCEVGPPLWVVRDADRVMVFRRQPTGAEASGQWDRDSEQQPLFLMDTTLRWLGVSLAEGECAKIAVVRAGDTQEGREK